MKNYDKNKSFIRNLIDEIKTDVKNATREQVVAYTTDIFYTTLILLGFVFVMLKPILNSFENHVEQMGDNADPIVLISLIGFLFLSLWFGTTWLNFFLARWTGRFVLRIMRIVK